MTSNPTPWRVIDREAESDSPLHRRYTLSAIVDADGHHVSMALTASRPESREVLVAIVRAVNLVSWLSPETIEKLEEVRAEFDAMAGVTA